MPRSLIALYAGSCRLCDRAITPGDSISTTESGWVHRDCLADQRRQELEVAAPPRTCSICGTATHHEGGTDLFCLCFAKYAEYETPQEDQ